MLDPGRLAAEPALPLPPLLVGALLSGLACRRLEGTLALTGEDIGLEVSTLLQLEDDPRGEALWKGMAPIEPAWLESVPSAGAMAVIVLACRPSGEFWDSAFALADRVEKTDPARARWPRFESASICWQGPPACGSSLTSCNTCAG